ncbi:glycoside hydrolase superfamily [Whalleya microplaca]|nr:glycoside hydrolase superfamily [Whalleya microplaca]
MSHIPPLVNDVYYPSWRIYRGLAPSALQVDCITRVFYAFVLVNPDGTLRPLDSHADTAISADNTQGCLAALAQLKQAHPHLRTLVSLGGGGANSASFPALASNPTARATLARSIRAFVDAHGLDGVDVDWEHPSSPREGADYTALLRALRDALPAPRYLLTSALPADAGGCLRHIDFGAAAPLLDAVNLMAYDFHGPWTETCGHAAQLYPPVDDGARVRSPSSGHRGVEYLIANGVPPCKIVLGVPVYARGFKGAGGVGHAFGETEELEYGELPTECISDARVDREAVAASHVHGERGFVSFDVPETVRWKAEYVRRSGLGGLFYWTGVGDCEGPESLVRAGYEALNDDSTS